MSWAVIDYSSVENDYGREQDCVFAECLDPRGGQAGPIWGHHEASVLRALATLTEECLCGASFHRVREDS